MRFSTPDQDNDLYSGRCATTNGWWFNHCAEVRLTSNSNGRWSSVKSQNDVLRVHMLVKLN